MVDTTLDHLFYSPCMQAFGEFGSSLIIADNGEFGTSTSLYKKNHPFEGCW
jgi:hypothetical protein